MYTYTYTYIYCYPSAQDDLIMQVGLQEIYNDIGGSSRLDARPARPKVRARERERERERVFVRTHAHPRTI